MLLNLTNMTWYRSQQRNESVPLIRDTIREAYLTETGMPWPERINISSCDQGLQLTHNQIHRRVTIDKSDNLDMTVVIAKVADMLLLIAQRDAAVRVIDDERQRKLDEEQAARTVVGTGVELRRSIRDSEWHLEVRDLTLEQAVAIGAAVRQIMGVAE